MDLSSSSLLALRAELAKKASEASSSSNGKNIYSKGGPSIDPYSLSAKKARSLDSGATLGPSPPSLMPGSSPLPRAESDNDCLIHRKLMEKSIKYRQMVIQHQAPADSDDEPSFFPATKEEPESMVDFACKSSYSAESLLQKDQEMDAFEDVKRPLRLFSSTKKTSGHLLVEVEDEFGRTRLVTPSEAAAISAARDAVPHSSSSHYDADWEIRDKGVAFYKFSKDSSERHSQMQALRAMDALTAVQRDRLAAQCSARASIRSSRMKFIREIKLNLQDR